MTNEVLKVMKSRRSIRRFKDEKIKKEELEAIIEAGLSMHPTPWESRIGISPSSSART